jgi:hypothetical protein
MGPAVEKVVGRATAVTSRYMNSLDEDIVSMSSTAAGGTSYDRQGEIGAENNRSSMHDFAYGRAKPNGTAGACPTSR